MIKRYWTIICESGPEVHGIAQTRKLARTMKKMLDQDEPEHRHRVVKFYPWELIIR